MSPPIIFNSIKVNSQSNGTTISIGRNQAGNWRRSTKVNLANSQNTGENLIIDSVSYIVDNDIVDSPFRTANNQVMFQEQAL